MKIVRKIESYRKLYTSLHGPIGLVPTLGGIHEDHLSLVDLAKSECATTVSWLFLNPKQFAPNEDLAIYPAEEKEDIALLKARGVDVLFIPKTEDIYPVDFDTVVLLDKITKPLEGSRRPGHFEGVTTIVSKMFNIIKPDKAYFGEKDAQQLRVIQKMVKDLNFPIEIISCPTIRDDDGVALSSRNKYLSVTERREATFLYRGLYKAKVCYEQGERNSDVFRNIVIQELKKSSLISIDYVSLSDHRTLSEISGDINSPALLSLAVHIGGTHLIDNVVLQ